ncbi:Astacin (Peptidase M12A) [Parelaphostrongylus tenuis]|uniref:Zinc metalloproteinase n=1 Tax=Parelaphostrongylus tenuis TaxID=148309 RepID=A0AAD5MP59_PARTN|nr:Astacin (Peptidase M12A) [Parelaphostrongylus tenuis]
MYIPPTPLFSPEIQRVITSLNRRTTAFSKPGEGYESVIAILKSYLERKSGTQYDPAAIRITPTNVQNELTANAKVAGIFYETDIVLTVPQASRILSDRRRFKRKFVANNTMKWQTPVIAYRFAVNDEHWKAQIRNVLANFSQNTCLRFIEGMAAEDYLIFNRGEGCYSSMGRLGGAQEISIGYGCEQDGIISHELGHTLGLWHEHSRPERDNYVTVYIQNALPGTQGQFQKLSSDESVDFDVPYDYGSVMHYTSTTFTKSSEKKTVVPQQTEYEHTIGSRVGASFLDYKALNKAYCSNVCRNNLPCHHGGYANPNSCDRCLCPTGLGGTYCEQVQHSNCGGELPMATYEWKNLSYSGSSIATGASQRLPETRFDSNSPTSISNVLQLARNLLR